MWEIWTKQIFEDILATVSESIIILDSDLKVISANRCFYDTFKVPPEKSEGCFIYDLANGQWDIHELRTLLEEILQKENRVDNYEIVHVFPDIGRKIMRFNARRVHHNGIGSPYIIILAVKENTLKKTWSRQFESKINEHRQTREELLRRNHELSVLFSVSHAASESLDLEKTINNAFDATLGVLNIEAGGIYLLEPDGETLLLCAFRGHSEEFIKDTKTIKIGEGISSRAIIEKRPIVFDISDYPTERLAPLIANSGFQTMASVPLLSAGQSVGALNLATVRVRAFPSDELEMLAIIGQQLGNAVYNARLYKALKQRTAEQEEANKELEAFSYSVSHDLRAPLRHIMAFSELLMGAAASLDEKSLHYLDSISESVKRMGILIDDLLSFSRMGRTEMQKNLVKTEQLVKEIINELSNETKVRNIIWNIASLPDVYGDPAMLLLVFTNLISNALKFTRTRNQARIDIDYIESDDGEITFFIRDNGVGFDMKYADQLFGVFQRLHSSKDFEGTGIGLANVKRIIQRHGGRVWAEGAVDCGAVFNFSLPNWGRN